jgi:NNP family nitrate/nitrite transporter-like MFS transporter
MLLARESPAQPEPKPLGQYLRPLRRPDTLWLSLLYAFTFGGFVGLASYLVIFFHDTYGLARVTAGSVAALCVFAGSFMRPVGGWLADRAGGLRVLAWVFIIASMGLGGVALRPSLLVATSLLVVAMAALGVGNGAVFQLAPLRFPREIGVVTGIIGAAGGLGGFVVPGLLGVLEDTSGDSRAGFFCLSLAGAYGLALLTLLRERWLSPAPHRFVTPRFRPSYGGGTAPVRSTIIR